MSYPVLPLVSYYGDTIEFDSRPNLVEQLKGGVKDRSYRHWKNRTKRSFMINATVQNRDELQEFLEANRGIPFRFSFDGTGENIGLFVCKSWSFSWLVYVGGAGGVWKLSLKLEQVFRPNFPPKQIGEGVLTLPIQIAGVGNVEDNLDGAGSGIINIPTISVVGAGGIS